MPKAKITAETVEVLKQAEAAANDPASPQTNLQQGDMITTKKEALAAIDADRSALRNRIVTVEDILKILKANLKELDEQYLDALKNTPDEYQSILREIFNF